MVFALTILTLNGEAKNTMNDNARYAVDLALATLRVSECIADAERDTERKTKMGLVIRRKLDELGSLNLLTDKPIGKEPWRLLAHPWERAAALTLLLDLLFTNPFAPYELQYGTSSFDEGLTAVAAIIGPTPEEVRILRGAVRDARRAHKEFPWKTFIVGSAAGALVLGVGGWVAAPLIGELIGGAAGLYGAAATSYGLALLGGGSLAIGGYGMAGGIWLIVGLTTMAGGGLGAGAIELLHRLTAALVRSEVIKLQTYYRVVVLKYQRSESDQFISGLQKRLEEFDVFIEEESRFNDLDMPHMKDLTEKRKALQTGLDWMNKQVASG